MTDDTYIDSDGSVLSVLQDWKNTILYFNSQNQRHRLDGPAVEYIGGGKLWYKNGKLHRLDGPAIERYDGAKIWFVDDNEVDPQVLVAYWLERGRCCWFDETTQMLHFSD